MNQAKQLYNLQEIDLRLGMMSDVLAQVESQLGESQALMAVRAVMEQERGRLAELEKEQHAAEWEAEDTESKCRILEEKLYSGKTRNPNLLSKTGSWLPSSARRQPHWPKKGSPE